MFVAYLFEIRVEAIAEKLPHIEVEDGAFEIATERSEPWPIAPHLSKCAKANLASERIAVAGARGRS